MEEVKELALESYRTGAEDLTDSIIETMNKMEISFLSKDMLCEALRKFKQLD